MMIATEASLEVIGRLLRRHRGVDLAKYRQRWVARRLSVRLRALKLDGLEAYGRYLDGHPAEYEPLLRALTISVTAFFRDRAVYDLLRHEVLPPLLAAAEDRGGAPVRVWSAGCSTGEEAYSLAILFHRVAGRWGAARAVGTDVDPEAIARAAAGRYDRMSLDSLPAELRADYFRPDGDGGFRTVPELARSCRFQVEDLFAARRSPRVARTDLLACRNVMIYLSSQRQQELLERFAGSLRPGGFLVLGTVERVTGPASGLFEPFDPGGRIFRRVRAEAH